MQVMSAGVERVLHLSGGNDLRDSKIILTNNQIVQGPEIADHAIGMLLTLSRGIHTFYAHTQQEFWQARPFPGIELNGRTAVVIGVGGIGTQIAFRALHWHDRYRCRPGRYSVHAGDQESGKT